LPDFVTPRPARFKREAHAFHYGIQKPEQTLATFFRAAVWIPQIKPRKTPNGGQVAQSAVANHWPKGNSWPARKKRANTKDQIIAGTPEIKITTVLVRRARMTGKIRQLNRPTAATSRIDVAIAAEPDIRWPDVISELKRTAPIEIN
jgi:hypothetical protein